MLRYENTKQERDEKKKYEKRKQFKKISELCFSLIHIWLPQIESEIYFCYAFFCV